MKGKERVTFDVPVEVVKLRVENVKLRQVPVELCRNRLDRLVAEADLIAGGGTETVGGVVSSAMPRCVTSPRAAESA